MIKKSRFCRIALLLLVFGGATIALGKAAYGITWGYDNFAAEKNKYSKCSNTRCFSKLGTWVYYSWKDENGNVFGKTPTVLPGTPMNDVQTTITPPGACDEAGGMFALSMLTHRNGTNPLDVNGLTGDINRLANAEKFDTGGGTEYVYVYRTEPVGVSYQIPDFLRLSTNIIDSHPNLNGARIVQEKTGLNWSTVQHEYEVASALPGFQSNTSGWNGNLAWFCAGGNSGTQIYSQSYAKVINNGVEAGITVPDGEDEKDAGEFEPGSEVEIEFRHYLDITKDSPIQPELYPAEITWEILGVNNIPSTQGEQKTQIGMANWNEEFEFDFPQEGKKKLGRNPEGIYVDRQKIKLPEAEEFTSDFQVCQTIKYDPKTLAYKMDMNSLGGGGEVTSTNAGMGSHVCVTFHPGKAKNKKIEAYSQSYAKVTSNGTEAGITIPDGTDSASAGQFEAGATVTIQFRHYLDLEKPIDAEFYNEKINWTITGRNNTPHAPASGTTTIKRANWNEEFEYDGKILGRDPNGIYNDTQTITLPKPFDKDYEVCQTIKYDPKTFNYDSASGIKTSGSGKSKVCITFQPPDPIKEDPELCKKVPYSHTFYKGDTNGYSGVRNMSSVQFKAWRTTLQQNYISIYARPGDSIQFQHVLCVGNPWVTSSDGFIRSGSERWGIANQNRTTDGGKLDETWFQITALLSGSNFNGPNPAYAFGERTIVKNAPRVELAPFSASVSGGIVTSVSAPKAKNNFYNNGGAVDADELDKGGFRVYSPSPGRSNNREAYICNVYDFAGLHIAPGYQIPGFDKQACTSAGKTRKSDAGDIIAQEFEWNNVRAWINDKNTRIEPCSACDETPVKLGKVQNEEKIGFGSANGSGLYKDTRKMIDPDCKETKCCPDGFVVDPTTGASYCPRWAPATSVLPTVQWRYHSDHEVLSGPKQHVEVKVPYNYTTEVLSKIDPVEVIYSGETVSSDFMWVVRPRINKNIDSGEDRSNYATVTPPDTIVRIIEFVVDSNIDQSTGTNAAKGNNNTPKDPCAYFRSQFSNKVIQCDTLWEEIHEQNPNGLYKGKTRKSEQFTRLVPDNVETGSTYCVAIGFYHTDSYGNPDKKVIQGDDGKSLSGASPNWNVSGASCRTIVKKPNFQVWNAGTYTQGNINTSLSLKYQEASRNSGVGFGDANKIDKNNRRIFGSWEEYEVIANGPVFGFSSAASLGYSDHSFKLPGGHANTSNFCDFTKMTIYNSTCNGPRGFGGGADIYLSNGTFLAPFYTRYLPTDTPHSGTITGAGAIPLDNGTEYIAVGGDANIGSIRRQPGSKTLIIAVHGTATITGDICYATGTCGSGDNNLVLNSRNQYRFANNGIASIDILPQVIIIASNIAIRENVTQIDAWLIAEDQNGGNINTCAGYNVGSLSTEVCNKTLIVNGPVFAATMTLNRTAGAWPGILENGKYLFEASGGVTPKKTPSPYNAYEGGRSIDQNLANDGSVTPGEIFNFRPDAIFWAYNQAQRYSQAVVTYSRELAPRY